MKYGIIETTSIILGPFLIKANLDGATTKRQINSNENHETHIVSIIKNVQNTPDS
jgi:hypothetical protein